MSDKKTEPNAERPPLIVFDPADGEMHAGTFDKTIAKIARRLARRYKCRIAGGDDAALSDLASRIMPGRIEDDRLMLASVTEDVAAELRRLIEPEPEGRTSTADPEEDLAAMVDDLRQAEVDGLGPLSEEEVIALRTPDDGDVASQGITEGDAADDAGAAGRAAGTEAAAEPSDRRSAETLWDALSVGDLVLAADLDQKGDPECWFEATIIRITPASYILRFRDYPRDGLLARTRRHVALLHPAP